MNFREQTLSILSLFTSSGTLICCALPITIAAVAGGAAVSSMITTFPWLIPITLYKDWLFLFAAIMISLNGFLVFQPKGKVACSLTGDKGCEVAGRFTKTMFWISVGVITTGAFFAYALTPIVILFRG